MRSWNLVKGKAKRVFNYLNNINRKSQEITKLKAERSELLEKLAENDKMIMSLKTALDNNGKIVSENGAYWRKDDFGNIVEGPFCITCFIAESALCTLVRAGKPGEQDRDDWEWVQCSKCRIPFKQKQVSQYLKTHKKPKTLAIFNN